MRAAVFNLTSLNPGALNCNSLIALYLSKTLKIPVWGDSVDRVTKLRGGEQLRQYKPDVLFIINGLMHHCHCKEELAETIRGAKQVIYVINDYHLEKPSHNTQSTASPVLIAIKESLSRGMQLDFWTTVPHYTKRSSLSQHIHWDYLFYNKIAHHRPKINKLLYYGAMRQGRVKTFDRFFDGTLDDITVMAGLPQHEKWLARYPDLTLADPVPHDQLAEKISSYALGLYLQDDVRFFVNPAARFYEMLGAGLPMLFQAEAIPRFEEVGINVKPFVLDDVADLPYFLKRRSKIYQAQQAWDQDYHVLLTQEIQKAWKVNLAKLRKV